MTQLEPIWVHLGPPWSDLEPTWTNLGEFWSNLKLIWPNFAQFGTNMASIWSEIGNLWVHLGPFGVKYGATVGPYIHMSILYSPCSTLHVFLSPYSAVRTFIARRILLHKQTRPQQYQLQSLPAALCESTIASCPSLTVYCHRPPAHPLLPITYCPLPGPAECAERLNKT